MIIVGLTGSIAMGKSFVAKQFAMNKIKTFNSDKVVARLLSKNNYIIESVKQCFPQAFTRGEIDKAKLGDLVFSDFNKLKKLEAIIYPIYNQEMKKFIKTSRYERQKLIILEIPLLFEKNYQKTVDYTITVSCSKFLQIKRALQRNNMSHNKLNLILKKQMNDIKKRAYSDYVIYTGLGKASSFRQVTKFINMVSR